tara:strand:+ start:2949 stop:3707 length:759 start_codon:yes stop_codon:yes gene_type:complete
MHKVAILIPTTSNKRDEWNTIRETYLFHSVKSFLLSLNRYDENTYIFYIGFDKNDRIFDNIEQQKELKRLEQVFKNISFEFICMENIPKGHLTKMWNFLFELAYNAGNEYFYQCGDDILYKTKGWVQSSINMLQLHENIGITGPINNNSRILTQVMVSRKHMEIFGWFFPEEIINWCCDDWYNCVYQPKHFYPLHKHYSANVGGQPRYIIDNNMEFHVNHESLMKNTNNLREKTMKLANKHKILIINYIKDK